MSNDYPQITLDLSTPKLDALMADVYRDIDNAVYRCGLATSQEPYDAAFDALFARLDVPSDRLSDRRYLMGDALTEADVRLFTTLVRFDAATTDPSRTTGTS